VKEYNKINNSITFFTQILSHLAFFAQQQFLEGSGGDGLWFCWEVSKSRNFQNYLIL
jgi:hypothetical protein